MTDPSLGQLGPLSGTARDVSVTLTGLTFRQTSEGRRYPYPDFGSDFIDALHKELLAPRRRGLLRSTLACPSCGSSLEGTKNQRVAATVNITLRRAPAIRLDVEMPGMTCPGCHRSLVRIDDRSVDSDLSDALIAAFDEAGIKPG